MVISVISLFPERVETPKEIKSYMKAVIWDTSWGGVYEMKSTPPPYTLDLVAQSGGNGS